MPSLPVRIASIACLVLAITAAALVAQRGAAQPPALLSGSSDATARIVASAQALLATLDAAGRARVQFPFDGAQKNRWSNLPSPMFQREGLRMGELTAPQRA